MKINVNGQIPSGHTGFLKKTQTHWEIEYGGKIIEENVRHQQLSCLGLPEYRMIGQSDGTAMVVRYADLHRHSDNSLQDGMTKIKTMVARTEYAGALTDHGVMYGFLDYYNAMTKAGKKPIIGFEGYMESMDGVLGHRHIILLAKNDAGYKNLLKLSSEGYNHFRYKPHVTWEMLKKYHEGIICLSACIGGIIPNAFKERNPDEAKRAVERYIEIFGRDDFYIEIQNHHLEEEDFVRPQLVRLAKEYGLKYVATTDSHYPDPEDAEAHEILLCLQTEKTISDETRLRYGGDGYHLHTSEEMEIRFAEYPEALDTSLEIAEKCNVFIKQGDVNLPKYELPEGFETQYDYFLHLCLKGFHDRFAGTKMETDPVYIQRLDYETAMIKQMGFAAYFIIVWDFINWARQHDIYIGPGRGSAAGSLAAYCMGITDLDPVANNLLFERFLNPERVSWPDIDTDIGHVGRPAVIQYMTEKYGEPNVARIVTFGTFAAKQVCKDVARVLEYPASFGAMISGMIPGGVGMTIEKALQESVEMAKAYAEDNDVRRVVDIAKRLEGGKRHASQHACGLVIAPSNVSDYIPTSMEVDEETGTKALTTQVEAANCELLSLLKMDLLGLKNLTVIQDSINRVEEEYGSQTILRQIRSAAPKVRYQDIPIDDRDTYRMFRDGLTGGVFQLESPGMTKVVVEMFQDIDTLPDERLSECFERLIACVALYRPGPMDYIPDYLAGVKDPSTIHYDCPEEESILGPTYGVMVYQEQLMQIAQKLAGFSLAEADILRKACGKKKIDLMNAEHVKFVHGNKTDYDAGNAKHLIPGCVGNGIPEDVAETIWDKMVKFASYAFNRSHAACYAWIAAITGYLSAHWPSEFYAAMLNAFIENSDKSKAYLEQANTRGIKLMLPDIQHSECQYKAMNGNILFGLQGINGLKGDARYIVAEREANGPYHGMQDLYNRLGLRGTKLNRKSLEGLIYGGAMQTVTPNKSVLLQMLDTLSTGFKDAEEQARGQMSMFGDEPAEDPSIEGIRDLDEKYALEKEYETLGMYVSAHPTELYAEIPFRMKKFCRIADIVTMETEAKGLQTYGLIKNFKRFFTKAGKEMQSFVLETQFASINCIVFPKAAELVRDIVADGQVRIVNGNWIRDNRGERFQFSVDEIRLPSDVSNTVYIRVDNKEEQEAVLEIVRGNPGNQQVVLLNKGKEYPIKPRMEMTLQIAEMLSERNLNR